MALAVDREGQPARPAGRPPDRQPTGAATPPQTFQFRQFRGANQTDARTGIGDQEMSWIENFLPIGDGALVTLAAKGTVLATLPVATATLWGFVLTISGVS